MIRNILLLKIFKGLSGIIPSGHTVLLRLKVPNMPVQYGHRIFYLSANLLSFCSFGNCQES